MGPRRLDDLAHRRAVGPPPTQRGLHDPFDYYQGIDPAIKTEGDMMQVIDVLAREVGVLGIFSDWPATTTFYANCAGLR